MFYILVAIYLNYTNLRLNTYLEEGGGDTVYYTTIQEKEKLSRLIDGSNFVNIYLSER